MRKEGVEEGTRLIVIHPGAGAAVKLWRPGGWAACANRLSQGSSGAPFHFILTGTASEEPLLREIARETIAAPTTVLTHMSIGQLAAVFQQARLVLGIDSGPLHLAEALAIPTVRIYGPIDPAVSGQWATPAQHTVIASTYRCSSCEAIPCGHLSFGERELGRHPYVRLVAEQTVLDAIARHLGPLPVAGSSRAGGEARSG